MFTTSSAVRKITPMAFSANPGKRKQTKSDPIRNNKAEFRGDTSSTS